MRSSWLVTSALCVVATIATLQGAWSTTQAGLQSGPANPTGTKTTKQPAGGTAAMGHLITADRLTWGPASPALPAGAHVAVLSGDPAATSGTFTIRAKLPDGYKVMPHTHPSAEYVTVLSGALRVGMGATWNEGAMQELAAGGFADLPASSPHYVQARGETVLQITATAPFAMTYVNPADDPRGAQATKPTKPTR